MNQNGREIQRWIIFLVLTIVFLIWMKSPRRGGAYIGNLTRFESTRDENLD